MQIKNAKVTITVEDPNEILEAMDHEEKLDFLQSISCQDEVIEYVMQQVFEGCTDNGSYGWLSHTYNGNTPLQKFQQKLIEEGADKISKQRLLEMTHYMDRATNRILELESELANQEKLLRGETNEQHN